MEAETPQKRLAIFIDWFEPGFKAGGPIRSSANLARLLASKVQVSVFTSDTDHGDKAPLNGVQPDCWTIFAPNLSVWYASIDGGPKMMEEFKSRSFDAVYFNSLFSVRFFIRPFLNAVWNNRSERLVLAPRGMLRKGALSFGKFKKKVFISLLSNSGLAKKLYWQATDLQEESDIKKHIGPNTRIQVIGNVPSVVPSVGTRPISKNEALTCVIVSRIQSIKNLHFFFQVLRDIHHEVNVDLIGPLEDPDYWETCQEIIQTLPENISVSYLGAMPHSEILSRMVHYDLFVLPTLGENFGHAIYDAMVSGVPVMISDQTPWQNLQKHQVGQDLPFDPELWKSAINEFALMDSNEQEVYQDSARKYAVEYLEKRDFFGQYHELFFQE